MRRRLERFSTQKASHRLSKMSMEARKLGKNLAGCLIDYGTVC